MADLSEWLQLMLAEIERKQEEERDQQPTREVTASEPAASLPAGSARPATH